MTRMEKIQTRSCTLTRSLAVGRGSDGVACVVAGAIGDDAGVAGVVFLDLEDDLHEVGPDVGDLGKDAAGHAEGCGAERFTDSEADEARTGQVARDEQQDEQHDQQFDRNQQHTDAHAGLQRDVIARKRLAAQRRECGSGVGEGVHAHAESGHREAPGDADHAEQQDDGNLVGGKALQQPEVEDDDDSDEHFEQDEELALRGEVSLAGLVDQLGDFPHGGMHRHVAQPHENDEPENQAEGADDEATQQQVVTADAVEEGSYAEIGQLEVGFAASLFLGEHGQRQDQERKKETQDRSGLGQCGSTLRDTRRVRHGEHRLISSYGMRAFRN